MLAPESGHWLVAPAVGFVLTFTIRLQNVGNRPIKMTQSNRPLSVVRICTMIIQSKTATQEQDSSIDYLELDFSISATGPRQTYRPGDPFCSGRGQPMSIGFSSNRI